MSKKFKNLKAGDQVFVVCQESCRPVTGKPVTFVGVVAKVGRKYGYIERFRSLQPFDLVNGRSIDRGHNDRANGYGFDVYYDKAEWQKELQAAAEFKRLRERLYSYGTLRKLSAVTVATIHAALDAETINENQEESNV